MRYILILIILLGVDRFGHAEEETNFFGLSKVSFLGRNRLKKLKNQLQRVKISKIRH